MQSPQNHGMWKRETVTMCLDGPFVPGRDTVQLLITFSDDFFSVLSNDVTCHSFGRVL